MDWVSQEWEGKRDHNDVYSHVVCSYLNGWRARLNFICPRGGIITGIMDNRDDDINYAIDRDDQL